MNLGSIVVLVVACCVIGGFAHSVYAKKSINTSKDRSAAFHKDIFEQALKNTFFRKELVTGKHSQVVIMSIPVGGEIGMERHQVDQTLVFVQGHGRAIINGESFDVYPNHLVFVPAGADHNFINVGSEDLKLFTVYAPAQHKPGTVQKERTAYD